MNLTKWYATTWRRCTLRPSDRGSDSSLVLADIVNLVSANVPVGLFLVLAVAMVFAGGCSDDSGGAENDQVDTVSVDLGTSSDTSGGSSDTTEPDDDTGTGNDGGADSGGGQDDAGLDGGNVSEDADSSDVVGTDVSVEDVPVDVVDPEDLNEVTDTDSGSEDTSGVADAGGTIDTEEPGTGFVSAELNLMIIGPQPYDWAQSLGAQIPISGILFGHADVIEWENVTTGDSGKIPVGQYWQTPGPVQLKPGDNEIQVTAYSDTQQSSDTIVVTFNPAFLFDAAPKATPPIVFTNTSTKVVVTAQISLYSNYDPNSVTLWESDEYGTLLTNKGKMADNGATGATCDEVQKDGVFSTCLNVNPPNPAVQHYRVSLEVNNVGIKYNALSPVFTIEAVDHFTAAECEDTVGILKDAKTSFYEKLQTTDPLIARDEVVNTLAQNTAVAEYGTASDGWGIWVRFNNGILGALNLNPPGFRGGGDGASGLGQSIGTAAPELNVGSKDAVILAPFAKEFEELDEADPIATTLKDAGCPYFNVGHYKNEQASMYRFRGMTRAGVIAMTSHGDALFKELSDTARAEFGWEHGGSQEIIWTGEPVNCGKLLQATTTCSGAGTECGNGAGECVIGSQNQCVDFKQADLRRGRIVIGPDTYGILPSYVKFHSTTKKFPKSMVYLGSCRSMYNGTFASTFFANGARTVVGYSDYVTSEFAYGRGVHQFQTMIAGGTAGDALGDNSEWMDPAVEGSYLRMFGAPNLSIFDSNVVNPSFETGDATGWQSAGDGRIVTTLGSTIPVDGKFMGLISTGLGFTQQTGELKQKFCIDGAKTKASFYWKYYSEEFLEWCGSIYQDAFVATIQGTNAKITVVDLKVDSLCPPNQCGGCGGKYVGLVPADVSFDQGGVYNTQWQKAEVAIGPLAGSGPVTFSYFTTDAGDSIYDTVVLIDKLVFE